MDNLLKLKKQISKRSEDMSPLHRHVFDIFWKMADTQSEYTRSSLIAKVAAECDLSQAWMHKFAYATGGSPSVDKLEILYTYLTGKNIIDNIS